MDLLKSFVTIKNVLIVLVVAASIFTAVKYVEYNGSNVAWCLVNGNDCRVARIQALQRNLEDVSAQTVDTDK